MTNGLRVSAHIPTLAAIVAAVTALALVVHFTAVPGWGGIGVALLLIALLAAALCFPLQFHDGTRLVLDTSVLFAAVLLADPAVALLIAGSGMLLGQAIRRDPWPRMALNTTWAMLAVGMGSLLLAAVGWKTEDLTFSHPVHWLMIVLVGEVLYLGPRRPVATDADNGSRWEPAWRGQLGHASQLALGLVTAVIVDARFWVLPFVLTLALVIHLVANRVRWSGLVMAAGTTGVERGISYCRLLLESTGEGVVGIDTEGRCTFVNRAAAEMLGYSTEELLGRPIHQSIHHSRKDGSPYPSDCCPDLAALAFGHEVRRDDEILWRRNGEILPVQYAASPIIEGGRVGGAVLTFSDCTEQRAIQEQLRHQALHDSLTGLPNRALFMHCLDQRLAQAAQREGSLAVLFLDLDGFKVINDTLGHDAGDQVLIAVGERLQACARDGDTVARFAGDEFTILLDDLVDASQATEIATEIAKRLEEPIAIGAYQISLTLSIGVAISVSPQDISSDLLRNADTAMYTAKANGKARYTVFDATWESAHHASSPAQLLLDQPAGAGADVAVDSHEPTPSGVQPVPNSVMESLRFPIRIEDLHWRASISNRPPLGLDQTGEHGLERAG